MGRWSHTFLVNAIGTWPMPGCRETKACGAQCHSGTIGESRLLSPQVLHSRLPRCWFERGTSWWPM